MLPIVLFAGLLSGIASGSVTQTPARATLAIIKPLPMATALSKESVTPATIAFTATDPTGTPVVTGSAGAVVKWTTKGGAAANRWTLQVSSPTTFAACYTVPASAVKVTCGSITGGTPGACTSADLTAAPITIAGGNEATDNTDYTVNLTFTLRDSRKYIASSSCSLSVTYTITAN